MGMTATNTHPRNMPSEQFDRWIGALLKLKAAYMRERDPKRSCQIYHAGYRIALKFQIHSSDNSGAGLRQFFWRVERAATCGYLLRLWAGENPWE